MISWEQSLHGIITSDASLSNGYHTLSNGYQNLKMLQQMPPKPKEPVLRTAEPIDISQVIAGSMVRRCRASGVKKIRAVWWQTVGLRSLLHSCLSLCSYYHSKLPYYTDTHVLHTHMNVHMTSGSICGLLQSTRFIIVSVTLLYTHIHSFYYCKCTLHVCLHRHQHFMWWRCHQRKPKGTLVWSTKSSMDITALPQAMSLSRRVWSQKPFWL